MKNKFQEFKKEVGVNLMKCPIRPIARMGANMAAESSTTQMARALEAARPTKESVLEDLHKSIKATAGERQVGEDFIIREIAKAREIEPGEGLTEKVYEVLLQEWQEKFGKLED